MFPLSFVAERAESIGADEDYRQRAFFTDRNFLLSTAGENRRQWLTGMTAEFYRRAEVLVLNTGLVEQAGRGFTICRKCGHWQTPKSKIPFEEHKVLHNRKQMCGGNAESYHLGYRFHTDALILSSQNIPDEFRESDSFFASLQSALIQGAASLVSAEDDEIGGFVRTAKKPDESPRRELVLFDEASGGSGYVRKAFLNLEEVVATARALLDNCQCEKSCYKCLRTYENQFEHQLLDKQIIKPYLEGLLS
jgi:hypothetical protein